MAYFDRFTKRWASTGVVTEPTSAQADAGFAHLGANPPTVEEFNALFQWLDDKDNWLYGQVAAAFAAAGLAPSSSDLTQLTGTIRALAPTRVKKTAITSSGTFTPDPKMIFCVVEGVGGGGGGGGAYGQPSPNVSAGSGGGGGGYFCKTFLAAQVGAAATVVIGASGSGGPAGQNNGANGGTTSFTPSGTGGALTAGGGGGGKYGITATTITRGDVISGGGASSGGEINLRGGVSGWALLFGGASYTAISGRGGDTPFGRGGQEANENANGNVGQGYGAGGSGGAALTASTAGAVGQPGIVFVTEYCGA